MLNRPPTALLTALAALEADHILGSEKVPIYMSKAHEKFSNLRRLARHPGPETDVLFLADYVHPNGNNATCTDCDHIKTVNRDARDSQDPAIHYGIVASGN